MLLQGTGDRYCVYRSGVRGMSGLSDMHRCSLLVGWLHDWRGSICDSPADAVQAGVTTWEKTTAGLDSTVDSQKLYIMTV